MRMAKKIPKAFRFQPFSRKQKKVIGWWRERSPYRNYDGIVADGSIRSGKTIAFIFAFILWSITCFTDQNFIISGRTIGALKRNVIGPMLRILRALKIEYVYNRSENYLEFGANTYYLFGADNEASSDLVQGITAAGWLGDEVALQHPEFLNQAMGRLLSVEGSKFWWNCNPESPQHTVKVDFIDKAKEKRILHLHFDLDDNLTLTQKAKEKAKRMFSGVFFKRYILGLWCAAEGAIYDMFDEAVHVVDKLPEMRRYWVGIDYGTTNPTVFLLLGLGVDDKLYFVDEWRSDAGRNKSVIWTDPKLSAEYRKWITAHGVQPRSIFVDPSAASFINMLADDGVRRLVKADNAVVNGIRRFSSLLGVQRLFIHRRCKGLIAEIQGYLWDAKASARGEDIPIKKNDHGPDGGRYIINGLVNVWRGWITDAVTAEPESKLAA